MDSNLASRVAISHLQIAHKATSYAFFSRPVYITWWLGLLFLHFAGAAYFFLSAGGYWYLPGTYLDICLTFYSLGMPAKYHHVLANVHLAIGICHATFALWMIGWSIYRRALVFGSSRSAERHRSMLKRNLATSSSCNRLAIYVKTAARLVWRMWSAVFGRQGFFGVDNSIFDLLLVLREIVETTLQTVQAYRMSLFLPRMWLNRFYLTLLVLNCWSTALVHHLYHDSPSRRRVIAILCDCILDATTSICIPLVLVLAYARDYDFKIGGFDINLWSDDVWFVNILNEFQLILVVSWGDLATRVLFSYSMISSMNSIKNLVRPQPSRIRPCQPAIESLSSAALVANELVAVFPECNTPQQNTPSMPSSSTTNPKSKPLLRSLSIVLAPKSLGARRKILTRSFSALFLLWGLAIIALHCLAGLNPNLPECKLQVRPWFVTAPACSLVELDCYKTGIDGNLDIVEAHWNELDARAVIRVVVKHCSHLQMPPALQKFYNLNGMKFYNSTIANWGLKASLTNSHHPKIMSLLFVRVNFTNGELPLGLQATDFPYLLADFEFCVTNLESLPDDLDLKWPKFATVYLELGTLTVVPDVIARLAPFYLSFAGSPIQELPAALFEADGIYYLHAAGTRISSLPQNVTHTGSYFSVLVLEKTNVSFFWPWIDEMLEDSARSAHVYVAGTPYCDQRTQVFQQQLADPAFGFTQRDEVSRLMDFSDSNQGFLVQKAPCKERITATIYPIEFEDEYSGMKITGSGL